jgi:hypothetical protein
MAKKKTKLKLAQEEAQAAVNRTNEIIKELGQMTSSLYTELTEIQASFDVIRNVPSEKKIQYEELKRIRLNWKQQAEKIEKDYKGAVAKNAGAGVAGAGLGAAVAVMGPTVAMGVATTFGVASTGTAISTLSGAAATNAALAWLGGGAIAAGGGGMAAGEAFLALAGPVGWAIAGVMLLTSGILMWKSLNDKKHIEEVFTLISKRDVTSYELAIVELNERIVRIDDECNKLHDANSEIQTFGLDYSQMSEEQQYALGAYVNLMSSSTQLLVNPILGLQPKYTEDDYGMFTAQETDEMKIKWYADHKLLIVSLANFLFKIELNERDKKLLWKALRNNKKALKSLGISKREFGKEIMDAVINALNLKYQSNE